MSWSVTLDQLQDIKYLPENILDKIGDDNPLYKEDALLAFTAAKEAGLVNATLSGGRTPNPYGGPDVVVIAITGQDSTRVGIAVPPPKFNDSMRELLTTPMTEEEMRQTLMGMDEATLRAIMEGPDDE